MAQADFTRIASNIGALNALQSLRATNSLLGMHQARLATGKRINSAEEDPAGLSIATKMFTRSESMKVALDNIGDAKNLLSVAQSGLQKVSDILVQMRTKAEAAASDTLGTAERTAIQSQLNSWGDEINSIVGTTKWNGNKLLDGLVAYSGTITFQVGADTDADNRVTLSSATFGGVDTTTLGIGSAAANATVSTATTDWVAYNGTVGYNEVTATTAAVSSGFTELGTATYWVRVNDIASNNVAVQLLDNAGNIVQIKDPTSGLLTNSLTVNISAGNATVDTGRGLSFSLVAANIATGDSFKVKVDYARTGAYNGVVSTATGARNAMDGLDTAIDTVNNRLATVGALAGRLSFRQDTLSVAQVNTEAAYSRIMNADMAYEQVEATKLAILQQTSMAMLGQANQAPQGILSLFR